MDTLYLNPFQKALRWFYLGFCALIFLFLVFPIFVIVPLSFNATPYFTFTPEMLSLDPDGFSLRWYRDFLGSSAWQHSIKNSFFIAIVSSIIATVLGTLASLGLTRPQMPYRNLIMSILISPLIVPIIISAVGMFFFFAEMGIAKTYTAAILGHAVLGTPFVVITVTATLSGFNTNLIKAAQNLGAGSFLTFRKVVAPVVAPGIISGALFAFVTSFDEVVVILFIGGYQQQTMTVQMWSGIREQLSPTILAVATLFLLLSVAMLLTLEILRRRNRAMRGIND